MSTDRPEQASQSARTSRSPRSYGGLQKSLLPYLLLLALVPLIALGFFCLDRFHSLYEEKLTTALQAETDSKQRVLDAFIKDSVSRLTALAAIHSYAELRDVRRLSAIFNILQGKGAPFADMSIIATDGRHEAYVGPFDLKQVNYADALWLHEVLHKGVYVSDVFMGFRQVPHCIIAGLRHEGEHSYILRATLDMGAVSGLLAMLHANACTEAFLVSEKGLLQTPSRFAGPVLHPFPLPQQDLVSGSVRVRPLSLTALAPQGQPAPASGASGASGMQADSSSQPAEVQTASESDPDRRQFMAGMVRLQSVPWVLVVLDDMDVRFAPLRHLRGLVLLFVLAGSLLVVMLAVYVTRRLVARMAAADLQQAHIDARMLQSSKMAALGKMAAGVAHEVNNPLMLIQENAGWIRDLLEDENPETMVNYKEIAKSTAKIEQHVKRAKGITQRMLGFGRRMNPGCAEVMLNALAEQAVELLQSEATARSIVIRTQFAPRLPVILSDQAQLEQVFINIVDNAIDAIGKDGCITITTASHGDGVRIIFQDDGPGMDEATRQRIFDPFFTTKKVGEGTGLGLAICFSILEKLGGHIQVESTVGKGTTFTIDLPREVADDTQQPQGL